MYGDNDKTNRGIDGLRDHLAEIADERIDNPAWQRIHRGLRMAVLHAVGDFKRHVRRGRVA